MTRKPPSARLVELYCFLLAECKLTSVYLTGTTLFLSLVLSRVFYILLDFIQTQEELTALKGSTAKGSTNAGENAELRKKIKVLQAELETVQSDADRDLCEY